MGQIKDGIRNRLGFGSPPPCTQQKVISSCSWLWSLEITLFYLSKTLITNSLSTFKQKKSKRWQVEPPNRAKFSQFYPPGNIMRTNCWQAGLSYIRVPFLLLVLNFFLHVFLLAGEQVQPITASRQLFSENRRRGFSQSNWQWVSSWTSVASLILPWL